MEELLNKLIDKGWKPFGKEKKELKFVEIGKEMLLGWEENYYCSKGYSYRELVSKESGLWQFVCENGMEKMAEGFYWQNIFPLDSIEYEYVDYQYWLIESALKDESELEQFLLENIKVE